MTNLKKIVDDWNALIDAGDKFAEGFSKLEYEEIRRFYSGGDLNNWEKGNRLLKVDSLKDFIFLSAKIKNGYKSYTDAVEKFFKNYKKKDIRLASLTYNYWIKIYIYLMSKASKEETLVELKNAVQTSKSMNAVDAFYMRNKFESVIEHNVTHDAALGMIEIGWANFKQANNNFILKIISNIKKEEWLSILTELSKLKYISNGSSEDGKYLMAWVQNAFVFEEVKTFTPSSFDRMEWKKPAIALAELVSKLIAEKIIVASIEDAQEINKVIKWMKSFFVFKSNEKSLMTYFKDARNDNLQSGRFKCLNNKGSIEFKIKY